MKNILLFLLHVYQLSRPFRPAACRFYPSCSTYACLCLEKHGVVRGCLLTLGRLLRCQPLHPGGVDEVPDVFSLNVFNLFVSKKV